jgi:hypothetical protein
MGASVAKHSGKLVVLDAGRAPHAPTDESRREVANMVACGLDFSQIAFVLNCSPADVRYWYKDELEHGAPIVNARVGAALLKNCLAGDTNAQKFWLATRAGWAPPTPEEQKKNQTNLQLSEVKRKLMDDIVTLVARDKETIEAADTVAQNTKGAERVQ